MTHKHLEEKAREMTFKNKYRNSYYEVYIVTITHEH